MANKALALDDDVRLQPIAGFDRDTFAIGQDIARGQDIGPGQAGALDLLAAIAVRRIRGKGLCVDCIVAILGLDAVEAALVAREFRLINAGLIVAEQRIELRALEFQIQATDRRGVIALLAAVGINGVVAARINSAGKAGVFRFFVAVIGQRHQPFAAHPTFGVKRNTAVDIELVVFTGKIFKALLKLVEADRASSKADNRPRAVTRIKPCLDTLGAFHLTVLKG